jgi:outer membrane protein assembly factor BamE (lipoprotein component of BamABCDE complex)
MWASGEKYVGNWGNNQINGSGTFTWPNGHKYIGQYKDGGREGYGTQYGADGTVSQQGNWKNDVFVSASENEPPQVQANDVDVPPMLEKLTIGMTKDDVLNLLGTTTTPGGGGEAIHQTWGTWTYYSIDIFDEIKVFFDSEENQVAEITFYVADDKTGDKTTWSNNIDKIQKGQTLKEVFSILGYPTYFLKGKSKNYAFYMGADGSTNWIYYNDDGLVDSVNS